MAILPVDREQEITAKQTCKITKMKSGSKKTKMKMKKKKKIKSL